MCLIACIGSKRFGYFIAEIENCKSQSLSALSLKMRDLRLIDMQLQESYPKIVKGMPFIDEHIEKAFWSSRSLVGSGRSGNVYAVQVGEERLAVKVCDFKDRTVVEELVNEINIYKYSYVNQPQVSHMRDLRLIDRD